MSENWFTTGELKKVLGVSERRITYACMKIGEPLVPAYGRGTVRRYSEHDALKVAVALTLISFGLEYRAIGRMLGFPGNAKKVYYEEGPTKITVDLRPLKHLLREKDSCLERVRKAKPR